MIFLRSRLNDHMVLHVKKEEVNNIDLIEESVDLFEKLKNL